MTGGLVVVLGRTGRNFAAGMSGGMAFVFDADAAFARRCNAEMVDLEPLNDLNDLARVRELIERHGRLTGSAVAARLLEDWTAAVRLFVKVMPREYRRALKAAEQRDLLQVANG
jgi:glutamate synthase domain-containing protein 3